MRPSELDVTLSLYELTCNATEDDAGGDEPYMWILGFKVDAETLFVNPNSILPGLGVRVFKGAPASPFIVGPGEVKSSPVPIPIPAALGTRSFRMKPAHLATGWFPGLAGIVCLLWDQDGFAPSTSEAGHNKLLELFGPALSTELTKLINGDYDDPLSRDGNDNITPDPPAGRSLDWRLSRLRDAAGRKHVIEAIIKQIKDDIIHRIKDAIKDAAGLDELIDRDDLLGAEAEVFLGDELSNTRNFSLRFTDDEADYTVKGYASASRVHVASLVPAVTRAERQFDRDKGLWLRVCWFPLQLYWASAFRLRTTTRFELHPLVGDAPISVRWLLDDELLADGQGSITVPFEPVDKYAGPPQDVLASHYLGGPSLLTYTASGSTLEVSNDSGNGVYYGKVTALYAYAGDPSLFPPPQPHLSTKELLALGYEQSAELGIIAVELKMSDEYNTDVSRCKRIEDDIDRKHIAVNLGRSEINPGDPPPTQRALLDRVTSAARVANAVGLDGGVSPAVSNVSLQTNVKPTKAKY